MQRLRSAPWVAPKYIARVFKDEREVEPNALRKLLIRGGRLAFQKSRRSGAATKADGGAEKSTEGLIPLNRSFSLSRRRRRTFPKHSRGNESK